MLNPFSRLSALQLSLGCLSDLPLRLDDPPSCPGPAVVLNGKQEVVGATAYCWTRSTFSLRCLILNCAA